MDSRIQLIGQRRGCGWRGLVSVVSRRHPKGPRPVPDQLCDGHTTRRGFPWHDSRSPETSTGNCCQVDQAALSTKPAAGQTGRRRMPVFWSLFQAATSAGPDHQDPENATLASYQLRPPLPGHFAAPAQAPRPQRPRRRRTLMRLKSKERTKKESILQTPGTVSRTPTPGAPSLRQESRRGGRQAAPAPCPGTRAGSGPVCRPADRSLLPRR
jgi:hypothetical protein